VEKFLFRQRTVVNLWLC